jgi:hypothetical protein
MLRRLTIITLEDVIPIEGYSMLVWMCSALSKGYILSDSQVCWVLSYIYRLCDSPHRENLLTSNDKKPYSLIGKQTYLLNSEQLSTVFSISFRRSYGGLTGDKKMLDYLVKLWYTRFRDTENEHKWRSILEGKQTFITPPSEKLHISEWILAAIDFHCYPGMIYNIQESFDMFTEKQIKDAIWVCSSSKTDKTPLTKTTVDVSEYKKHLVVWKKINRKFHSLAKFYLSVKS